MQEKKQIITFTRIMLVLTLVVLIPCGYYGYKLGNVLGFWGQPKIFYENIKYDGLSSSQHKQLDEMCVEVKQSIQQNSDEICNKIVEMTISGFAFKKQTTEIIEENGKKYMKAEVEFANAQKLSSKEEVKK